MAPQPMTTDQYTRYSIIVTGASGNIGRHLVPRLAASRADILAVGRDAEVLRKKFASVAGVDVCSYASLDRVDACDTFIHLAAHNNDRPGTLEDFTRTNVEFAERMCREFIRLRGRRFVNVSSVQVLDENNLSPYAVSKEMGRRRMLNLLGERLDNIHIGYFYDEEYFGERFSYLSSLGRLGKRAFEFFKTVKPTTSAQSLAEYIESPPQNLLTPKILVDDLTGSPIYRAITRAGDIVVATCILLGLLPVLLGLWAWVRLDSRGPAIFAQTRVGRNQRPFTLYKFRTMKRGTLSVGTHEVSAASVTRAGKFLRRTKLDELPQAVNLLRGDMTLVGPRPCLPVQEDLVEARRIRDVFAIKPGITGYAQVRGIDMSRPAELAQCDYVYMKLQSIALNLRILMLTVLGRGAGDHVSSSGKL